MRKLWIRRRGNSTMIGGIIVLGLFMLALAAMILVNQQYDTYQSLLNTMQQKDSDKFSENLVINNMTLSIQNSTLNQYSLVMSNYGIGLQIARIYVNSSASGCYPGPCIFGPSNSGTYKFQMSSSFLNAGELNHIVNFWLPNGVVLTRLVGQNTILVSTTRGRVFAFQWPMPVLGPAAPGTGSGGTGLNIGPLVIQYETVLITYDQNGTVPLPDDSGWVFPSGANTYIIFYLKIANQADTPVTIWAQSLLQIKQYGAPGNPTVFYLVAPMDDNLCSTTFASNPLNSNLLCGSLGGGSLGRGSYGGGNTYPHPGKTVIGYSNSTKYVVPPSSKNFVCCGKPIYLLFGADAPGSSSGVVISVSGGDPVFYTYLDIIFSWDNGSGPYTYGVNLPFLTICAGTGPWTQNCPRGN